MDLYTIGWALIGLLLLSIFSLNSATATDKVTGDPYSYDRGGAAGFMELLQSAGYHVQVDSSLHPALNKGDVAVAFQSTEKPVLPADGQGQEQEMDKSAAVAQDRLKEWRNAGGTIFWMPVGPKVVDLQTKRITSFPGANTFPTEAAYGLIQSEENFPNSKDRVKIGSFDNTLAVANLLRYGNGLALVPVSGELGLNYAIGKSENARILLRLMSMVVKPGGRVVFTTATMEGGKPPSFFEAIGPWALAAWKQLLLLLIVIAITLGSRFGLPDEQRIHEQGSRELLDALGGIYERARAVDTALAASVKRAEARIARRLKLSANADLDAYREQMPPSLWGELNRAKTMIGMKADAAFVVSAVAKLDRETDEFVGTTTRPRTRNRY